MKPVAYHRLAASELVQLQRALQGAQIGFDVPSLAIQFDEFGWVRLQSGEQIQQKRFASIAGLDLTDD